MPELDVGAKNVGRIRIVNNNDFTITDQCDSVVYQFAPRVPVDIPLDAALHIFGFHLEVTEQDVYKHVAKRFGWNTPTMVAAGDDVKRFDNLEIRPVTYKLVECEPAELEQEPETPPEPDRPRPRKYTQRKPRAGIATKPDADSNMGAGAGE